MSSDFHPNMGMADWDLTIFQVPGAAAGGSSSRATTDGWPNCRGAIQRRMPTQSHEGLARPAIEQHSDNCLVAYCCRIHQSGDLPLKALNIHLGTALQQELHGRHVRSPDRKHRRNLAVAVLRVDISTFAMELLDNRSVSVCGSPDERRAFFPTDRIDGGAFLDENLSLGKLPAEGPLNKLVLFRTRRISALSRDCGVGDQKKGCAYRDNFHRATKANRSGRFLIQNRDGPVPVRGQPRGRYSKNRMPTEAMPAHSAVRYFGASKLSPRPPGSMP